MVDVWLEPRIDHSTEGLVRSFHIVPDHPVLLDTHPKDYTVALNPAVDQRPYNGAKEIAMFAAGREGDPCSGVGVLVTSGLLSNSDRSFEIRGRMDVPTPGTGALTFLP